MAQMARYRAASANPPHREVTMREVIANQPTLGAPDIASVDPATTCRDGVPALLIGLQAVQSTRRSWV